MISPLTLPFWRDGDDRGIRAGATGTAVPLDPARRPRDAACAALRRQNPGQASWQAGVHAATRRRTPAADAAIFYRRPGGCRGPVTSKTLVPGFRRDDEHLDDRKGEHFTKCRLCPKSGDPALDVRARHPLAR